MHLISLGHSCQTRFIIDHVDAGGRRMPFDFNITTRQAVIRALATDGASLAHDEGSASIFRAARDGRTGINAGGLYFWHDYPLAEDKLALADGWQRDIPRVNEKYAALWSRFSALLRSDAPKTLLLSNSQHNLPDFAADGADFHHSFGLGLAAFEEISQALDAHGARNWRLLLLTRDIADLAQTIGLDDPRLDHRYVGTLSLRPDMAVAESLAIDGGGTIDEDLSGTYEDATFTIRSHRPGISIIFAHDADGMQAHGAITQTGLRPMIWLKGRRNTFSEIAIEGSEIRLPDGTRWRRDADG